VKKYASAASQQLVGAARRCLATRLGGCCLLFGRRPGRRGKRLVAIIVSIARAFQMTVVAEGVETAQQLEMLSRLRCDQSQGYLHSKPINREQFAELLRRSRGVAHSAPAAARVIPRG
jgi:hypothetical protein